MAAVLDVGGQGAPLLLEPLGVAVEDLEDCAARSLGGKGPAGGARRARGQEASRLRRPRGPGENQPHPRVWKVSGMLGRPSRSVGGGRRGGCWRAHSDGYRHSQWRFARLSSHSRIPLTRLSLLQATGRRRHGDLGKFNLGGGAMSVASRHGTWKRGRRPWTRSMRGYP